MEMFLLGKFVRLCLSTHGQVAVMFMPLAQLVEVEMEFHLLKTAFAIMLNNCINFVSFFAKIYFSGLSLSAFFFFKLLDLPSPFLILCVFLLMRMRMRPMGKYTIIMIAIFALEKGQFDRQSFLMSQFSHKMIDLMVISPSALLQLMQAILELLLGSPNWRAPFSHDMRMCWRSGYYMPERTRVCLLLILLLHLQHYERMNDGAHQSKCQYSCYYLNFLLLYHYYLQMPSTCLLCYEDSEHWVLPPCNHRDICWKCCLKLIDGSIFSCPFCKSRPEAKSQLLFVTTAEMQKGDYQAIMRSNPFRSNKNSFYFYSCAAVAEYIEAETSFHCVRCGEVHQSLNLLRKHLSSVHRLQFCEVCLDNRRCITGEQRLFSDLQLQAHLRQGDLSQSGEVLLYHPNCEFCSRRFYDIEAFRMHLRMSSHLKCEVCDINAPRLKYVYYKNYDDLQRHHKKTHHVCDVGDCVGKKLENVFASQGLLEQHKRRCHRKHRNDRQGQEKVQNILLGFNQQAEGDLIEFDGIGRNLEREFTVFERQEKVDKQQHCDQLIDIREFYPEIIRNCIHARPEDVAQRLENLHQRFGMRTRQVRFNDVPLFKPLEMTPLSRTDLERLLRRCFEKRDADGIIETFFTKRHEFSSGADYFSAIEKRMKNNSLFAFYLIFPQLVRFMKDENRNKAPMDEHYALRLRTLTVGKELLCHAFDRYSQLLQFLRGEVRVELAGRCDEGRIDIDSYCRYLRQMNSTYYVQHQEDLYFVPREKATNLYHMIERCRTRDFLKMNWLLKVGLPQAQYQLLVRSVHYKTRQECESLFTDFRLKELALLNLYFSICLEALLDQRAFENNKRNPRPHYLSDFLATIPRPKTISAKLYDEIRSLEGHSNAIERKAKQRTGRPIVVDEGDCPSLLQAELDPTLGKRKPPDEPELGIGKSRLPIWNEEDSIKRKNLNIKPQEPSHDDDFPLLIVPNKKQTGPAKKVDKQPEEDFPVYNFNEKYVTPKPAKNQTAIKIEDFIGFNSKTVTSKWDETRTRERFEQMNRERQREEQQLERARAEKKNKKEPQKKEKPQPTRLPSEDEDEYLKLAIQESLRSAEQEERERKKRQEEVVLISRKDKKIEEEKESPRKGKNKPKQEEKKQEKKEERNDEYLFEVIQREAQLPLTKPKKEKPPKMRIDYSDSDDDVPAKPQPKLEPRPQAKRVRNDPINTEQFMPIGGGQGESIITKLQKEAASIEVEKSNKTVKNGRKGKKVVIERVNLF